MRFKKGFTLIELLIVIAIVAVLAVTVVLTLNPAELLKQARDTTRISDLVTLEKALALYQTESRSSVMGTSSVVYVSLPDSSSSCVNLDLPVLPTGWTYRCSTSTNLRKTDGTGWIPVNFGELSSGSPLSALPIDPVNVIETAQYYAYAYSNSGWELVSGFESEKYRPTALSDGGSSIASIERGTSLVLMPQAIEEGGRDASLIGYWGFEEASGTAAVDWGRNDYSGTLTGSITRHTGATCRNLSCIYLNGTSDQVTILNTGGRLQPTPENTIAIWFKMGPTHDAYDSLFGYLGNVYDARMDVTNYIQTSMTNNYGALYPNITSSFNLQDGNWHLFVRTYSRSEGVTRGYIDGVFRGQTTFPTDANLVSLNAYNFAIGSANSSRYFNGYIDELRFYRRALSPAEIQALYNASK